jgi:hypothetical protein
MAVGARKPVSDAGTSAMHPVRFFGNALIQSTFRLLIGRGPGDLLSGYRAFGPAYLQAVAPRSAGFEIETELTGEAVARGFRVVEVPVPYYPRTAGTVSKLRAGRDGARILWKIVCLAARLRPWRLLLFLSSLALGAVLGRLLIVGRLF